MADLPARYDIAETFMLETGDPSMLKAKTDNYCSNRDFYTLADIYNVEAALDASDHGALSAELADVLIHIHEQQYASFESMGILTDATGRVFSNAEALEFAEDYVSGRALYSLMSEERLVDIEDEDEDAEVRRELVRDANKLLVAEIY